ncbi:hypothetical protein BT93_H0917 [Corymbia citriodora subsp. variegata]|nr:hypothetical protein BT93_H0917 [Corymbia citriodora subsp. variegata]
MAEKKPRVEKKLPNEGAGDKKWAKRNVKTYKIYIFKVLKQKISNSFIFDKLAQESPWLMRYNQKLTITSREI